MSALEQDDATGSAENLWQRIPGKIGVILTVAVSLSLLVTPVATQETSEGGVDTTETLTLVQSEGWAIAIVFAVPVLLALIAGFAARRPAIAAIVVFAVLAIMSLPSIGLLYLPSVIALGIAAMRRRRLERAEDAPPTAP